MKEYYLNETTRVKTKYHFPSLGNCIVLQRKRWWGWKAVSWTYSFLLADHSSQFIIDYLIWKEAKETSSAPIDIMEKIINDKPTLNP